MKTLIYVILALVFSLTVTSATYPKVEAQNAPQLDSKGTGEGSNKDLEDRIIAYDKLEKLKAQDLKEVETRYEAYIKANPACDLSFISEKDGTEVNAPSWFVTRIKDFSCRDKKILTRLAYYESNFDINAKNEAFTGLYQIGNTGQEDDTMHFCINNGAGGSDEDCARFLFNYDAENQFETVKVFKESFKEFL